MKTDRNQTVEIAFGFTFLNTETRKYTEIENTNFLWCAFGFNILWFGFGFNVSKYEKKKKTKLEISNQKY